MSCLAAGVIALMAAGLPVTTDGAHAQSDQWNSLYDRIIRLEARVKSMGSGGAGGGASDSQRLGAIEDQIRRLVGEMQSMSHEMQRMRSEINALKQRSGQQGRKAQPGTGTKQAQAPAIPSYNSGYGTSTQPYIPGSAGSGTETIIEYDNTPAPQPGISGGTLPAPGQGQAQGQSNLPGRVETATLGAPAGTPGQADASPDAIFKGAKDHLLNRRFGMAEAGFRQIISEHRNTELAGRAQYWLGETYYGQGRYRQAAQTFVNGYRSYGKSKVASDMLLKLGMSLSRLGQTKQACQTLRTVKKKYSGIAATRDQAQREMDQAGC